MIRPCGCIERKNDERAYKVENNATGEERERQLIKLLMISSGTGTV
jgi:hypothetical protein